MKFSNFDSKDGNNLKNVINSHKNRQNINSTPEQEEENEEQQSSLKDKAAGMGKEAIKEGASEAVHAATGVPKGIVKPVVSAVVDKVGDEAIDEVVNQAKQQVKKSIRKVVLKVLSAAAPYLLVIFLIVFVVGIIMTEFYQIVDKVDQALVKASEYEEKFLNWSTGNGWKTEKEEFFGTLNKEYKLSLEMPSLGGKGFNVPLIAATIHYNYMVELDLYNEDEDVGKSKSKHKEDYIGSGDEESLFDDFIRTRDTKNFYETANDKLGHIGAVENVLNIGQRRLLGHMIQPEFEWKACTLSEARAHWEIFFRYVKKTFSVSDMLDLMKNPAAIIMHLKSLVSTAMDYAEKDGSAGWLEYTYENALYEIEELIAYFEERIESMNPLDPDKAAAIEGAMMDYNNARNDSKGFFEKYRKYFDFSKGIPELWDFICSIFDDGAEIFPAPKLDYIYTEEVYKDYLRNIYIPLTYGVGEPRSYGSDATTDYKLDTIVSEIYNQSDTFIYLFQVDTALGEDCHYELVGVEDGEEIDESSLSGTVTVNGIPLTNEVIDNLYVRITNGSSKGQTVSMEDYMIGVMSAEINTITNIEARKANMVAQQTYLFKGGCGNGYVALHQEEDGNYYVSIDGTDKCQSYSSSQARADEIRQMYNEMKYEFLYNERTGSLYPIQYRKYYKDPKNSETNKDCFPERVGTCMGQIESDKDASDGMSYRDILAKYYMDSGLISYGNGKRYIRKYVCYSKGLVAGNYSGGTIRVAAPSMNDVFYRQLNPCQVWLGQCSWYVGGRAVEVLSTVDMDEGIRQKALSAIRSACPNGNGWYAQFSGVFGGSTDYRQPRDYSIASYRCTDGSPYGHVVFVEKVEGNNVYVSQGWTTNSVRGEGGLAGFNFRYPDASNNKPYTIDEMFNLNPGNGHGRSSTCNLEFAGYIYLLD